MKGDEKVSEKEKQITEKLKKIIPQMTDFQKGYVLGMVEGAAKEQKCSKKKGE